MFVFEKGMVCRHCEEGSLCSVLEIANRINPTNKSPRTVVYTETNGNIKTLRYSDFAKKFEMLPN